MCFLEKGNKENTADEIHNLLEREMNVFVYSPRDWVVLMRQIKSEKCHHKWEAARPSFWQDESYSQQFSNFHKDENGTPVSNWKWSESWIQIFYFSKNEYNQQEFQQINLLLRGGKGTNVLHKNSIITNLKSLYSSKLPIWTNKHIDLIELCE